MPKKKLTNKGKPRYGPGTGKRKGKLSPTGKRIRGLKRAVTRTTKAVIRRLAK